MKINMQFDTSALKVKTDREIKRLAYNTALALNETAKAVQVEEKVNLDRKFRIRNAQFMYRLIKIFTFASASQGRPYAEIGIDPTKKRVLLGLFERGGERVPAIGKSVAVPLTGEPARPSFAFSVAPAYRFSALRFHLRKFKHPRPGARPIYVGARKTFQMPGKGVFQRIGGALTAIYRFIRRPRVDARLDFIAIARQTIAKEWPEQFRKAYRK